MKTHFITKSLLLIFFMSIFSCTKDNELLNEQHLIQSNEMNFEKELGVLNFQNQEVLTNFVDNLKELNQIEREKSFEKFYDSGFFPLYLVSENIETIQDHMDKKLKHSISLNKTTEDDDFEDQDFIIPDNEFASILNLNRELIVGDEFVKYTEKGLLRSEIFNYQGVRDYEFNDSEVFTIGDNDLGNGIMLTKTFDPAIIPCDMPIHENGNIDIKNLIHEIDPCGNNGGGYNPPPPPPPNPVGISFNKASLINHMNNLEPCSTSNNFMGIFGPDLRCWSSFDSSRRTKTVFWKSNYVFYRSIGVKVKHQKRHWAGWWYASDDNDQNALAVSHAYFKMKPTANPPHPNVFGYQKLYFWENKIYNSQREFLANAHNVNFSFPNLPLQADITIADFFNGTTGTEYLSASTLRSLVYNNLWSEATSLIQQTFPTRQLNSINYYLIDVVNNDIHYIYVDLEKTNFGKKKLVHTFDFNGGISLTFNAFDGNGTSFEDINSVGFTFPGLWTYEDVEIDFVGSSRRGSVWKGSRLRFSE